VSGRGDADDDGSQVAEIDSAIAIRSRKPHAGNDFGGTTRKL